MITIGIDIDSTINMAHYYDIIHGREICKKYGLTPEEKLNKLHVKEMFDLPNEVYNEYMRTYFPWNCRHNTPDICAPECIRILNRDYRIVVVTARDENYQSDTTYYTGEDMKRDTIEWFKKNNIPVSGFHFSAKDKAEVCKKNNISIMIDDDPKNIVNCADKGIYTIIAAQSYNEHLIGYKNTFYARGWIEIMHEVKQYAKRLTETI